MGINNINHSGGKQNQGKIIKVTRDMVSNILLLEKKIAMIIEEPNLKCIGTQF